MRMPGRVEELLNEQHVAYQTLHHQAASTAQEVAEASHVPGRKLAKVVALRTEEQDWILAMLPAPFKLDLEAIGFWTGLRGLRLATEAEVRRRFPDCEPGAVPPFEQLHDVPVLLDDSFADTRELYFEDGSRQRLVGMRVTDFVRVAGPAVCHFSIRSSSGH